MAFGTVAGSTVQCGSELAVGTHAELEGLRSRLEAAGLVRAEAVLAGQHHRERPARPGCPAQCRLVHGERDVARDLVGADRDGAHRGRVGRIDEPLAEALHLEQPAPGARRRDGVVRVAGTTPPSTSAMHRAGARRRQRAARRAGCRRSATGRGSGPGRSPCCRCRRPGNRSCRTRQRGNPGPSGRRNCPGPLSSPVGSVLSNSSVPWTTSLTTVRTTWAVPPFRARCW